MPLLLIMFFFIAGCMVPPAMAPKTALRPYSVLTARDPSQHHLIDDFLKQEMKNRVGGAWRVSSAEPTWASTEFVRDDALKPQGFCLKMTLDIPKGEEVILESDLNLADVSSAKAFSFWLKMDRDFHQALSVEISNNKGGSIFLPLKDLAGKYKQWQEMLFNETQLSGMRLEGLKNLKVTVSAKEKG